jgi:peptide/nickel transport system substrate-binding protein
VRSKLRKTLGALMAVACLGVTAAACGGNNAGKGGGNNGGGSNGSVANSVTISDEYGETWPCQFNPYNGSDTGFSFGPVYEMLVFANGLKSGAAKPWLATKWAYANGNKTLTFTIRKGVTWSSGKPFSAKDVVYSFELLKKYPALDLNSDWSVLSSVTEKGSDQVVFNFKYAAVPYFYYIANSTPIVPEYIWSKVKNPVTYLDKNPVGTGGFVMSSCTSNNIQYTKNPHYWQKGLPKIQTVNFPAYTSNTPANEDLASGKDQWGSQFIPNIKKVYTSANPRYYHYWLEPVSNVDIFINLKNPVLSDVAVRKAMAYAIDRPHVSKIGEYGEEPPANQTGIVKPTFSSWYDSSLAAQYGNAYAYDPHKAIATLEAAGYKRGSDGIFAKNGQKLSFSLVDNGGYSDWVASVNVIVSELKAVGIQVTPQNATNTTWTADVQEGHYQLAYDAETGGPSPYYELDQLLNSPNSAPIGKTASSDWERYTSPATDRLFKEYNSTTSQATQHQIIDQLEKIMLSDVPVIPITEQVDWYQYDTQHLTGWVTPENKYAQPAQYLSPDWGVVLLHLHLK